MQLRLAEHCECNMYILTAQQSTHFFILGVGVCMVCLSSLVGIYYNVIIAYTVFYFFSSLSPNLPWESCDNLWNNKTTCSTEYSRY